MNGVVKTDESDSLAGDMPESAAGKPENESGVIQPPGIGPAIHLNGSACPVQDQSLQVSHFMSLLLCSVWPNSTMASIINLTPNRIVGS